MKSNEELRARLHRVIPGGAHTYSRGDDQYPSNAPALFTHGEGAYLYDSDGNRFLDYAMGLRSVNIGYGNKEIADAAYLEILKGNNLSRASMLELEAAELLVSKIPSIEMVKFAKHGSTVTTAAVKLARAYTEKKYVLVPTEQPFFSFDDWFIGSTPLTRGTLQETSNFTLRFPYNNLIALENLIQEYDGQIACLIMEPATHLTPCNHSCVQLDNCAECPNHSNNYLKKVQEICNKNGIVFILDEMITGFRWHLQGAQTFYGINPDLSTFGKAMANGFAVAALTGKREIMELGNILTPGHERVFLTSTTHGAEMSSLGAFIKTVEILERDQVIPYLWEYGKKLIAGMILIATEFGIKDHLKIEGYACSPVFNFLNKQGVPDLGLKTLFGQEMLKQNVMMMFIVTSFSHQNRELEITLDAFRKVMPIMVQAIENGYEKYLEGKVVKPVFRKYN
jgi:glutamate-1-semialdehyde 2,1-aminomutase